MKFPSQLDLETESIRMRAWLLDYVKEANANGVVIGLSGGFDSSFAAFLAASDSCLGRSGVLGILMPCDSSPDSITDATDVAMRLRISSTTVDLKPAVEAMTRSLSLKSLTSKDVGNIKARMRMITLYAFASTKNLLVLNTTNRSEAATGNGTKFGDAAGDLSMFMNFTKTELYMMARAVNFDLVFPQIMDKVPTADLEPNQTDEKTMGVCYADLDRFLCGVTETYDGKIISLSPEVTNRCNELYRKSTHKRHPMPCYTR